MSAKSWQIHVVDSEKRWDARNEDEALYWPRVLWIDPGVTSGVACVWFDPKTLVTSGTARAVLAYAEQQLTGPEEGRNGQAHRYLQRAKYLGYGDESNAGLVIGVESFVPLRLNQDRAFLAPVRIRAMVEYGRSLHWPELSLYAQSPSDAIGSFSNERLRALRMYTPGPDHVNDAKRHCLLWMRRMQRDGRPAVERFHGKEESWWS